MCYGEIQKVLGFIFVDYDKNRRYLHTFVMGAKSLGLGSMLLDYVTRLENKEGCFLELAVDFFNRERLIRFYKRHNFILADDGYPCKMVLGVRKEAKTTQKRLLVKTIEEYADHRLDTYLRQRSVNICPPYKEIAYYLNPGKFSSNWVNELYIWSQRITIASQSLILV